MEEEKLEPMVVEESNNSVMNSLNACLDLHFDETDGCVKNGAELGKNCENVTNGRNITPDESITTEQINTVDRLPASNEDLHSSKTGDCMTNSTELLNETCFENVANSISIAPVEKMPVEQVSKVDKLTANNDLYSTETGDCVKNGTELGNEVPFENLTNGFHITPDESVNTVQLNKLDELTEINKDLYPAGTGDCEKNSTELAHEVLAQNVTDGLNIAFYENMTTEQFDKLTGNNEEPHPAKTNDEKNSTELHHVVPCENVPNSLNLAPDENMTAEQMNESVKFTVNNEESTMEITTREIVQPQDASGATYEQNQEVSASSSVSDDFTSIKVKQEVISDDEDMGNDDVELIELEEDNLIALSIKTETKIKVEEIDLDTEEEYERRIFECPKCQEKFVLECLYLFHVIVVHDRVKPYPCALCKVKTPHTKKLLRHLRRHTKEKKELCKICQKYYYYWEVSKHLQNCPLPTTYNCNLCEFRTRKRFEFLEHIRWHTGERPYICRRCGVGFISCSAVKKHFKIHITEKFNCHICERQFRTPSNRDKHVVTYASKKCPKCDYVSFSCKDFYLHAKCTHMQSKFQQKLDATYRRLAAEFVKESSRDFSLQCKSEELLQPSNENYEYETLDSKEDLRNILYSNLNSV